MMCAYAVSTKGSVVVAVVALAVVMSGQLAKAQPGWVLSHQKISDTQGGFKGILDGNDIFGWSVASLGDLDGDGVDDVAVGAPFDDDGGFNRGAVWILFLKTDGTVKSHQKISDTEGGFTGILDDADVFGSSLTSLGDLDGDGVGDLSVGAFRDDDGGGSRGAVWVLFLNREGTTKSHQKISDTEGGFTGILDDGDFFGISLTSLGDLDGDGVGDLAVGAWHDDDGGTNSGAVWILFLDGIAPGKCPWDVNGDGVVDHHDLVEVVHNLGPCDDPDNCPWDVNGDGVVNGRDVAAVAMNFGACP